MRYAQGGGLTAQRQAQRERIRLEAADRFARGERTSVIARDLRVSERSVERWRRAWREGGARALRSTGPPKAPKLSDSQFELLEAELGRGPAALRPWVVLVDGARHQLDLIAAEADRRGIRVHVLLDFVHVAEYVWAAAHAFHKPGTSEAEAWAAGCLTAILSGDAARAAAQMTAQAKRERLPAARREAVDACHRYLAGHLDQLHYDTALNNGWPIATGAVEGACRHLIADRLDLTGARWGLLGAEAVLRLRAVVSNGDLDLYWCFHAAREHERLYPAPDQRQLELAA